ncbi:hypothetical protein H9Y04_35655 [Streptomyces sp. TRM66268-LWL]|uniref:Uncharacterized protein n=1 Tax=Streptomyces polyasparticus TaxID=2767826 RepID=A0ABR7ST85_9ACTN|nr:hypothetical protein [Streptomyces polyasparticus]MBC9717880.1 hypothetical protein [Streptomyces polyasparticus]
MTELIRRAAAWMLLLILPGTGRHRTGDRIKNRPAQASWPRPISQYVADAHTPLDGAASALVRPYTVRRRQLALVLAADYGIDLDQHVRGAAA